MDTVEGVVEATTLGALDVVVVFDAGHVAEPPRVLVHVVTVPVDVAVVVVF